MRGAVKSDTHGDALDSAAVQVFLFQYASGRLTGTSVGSGDGLLVPLSPINEGYAWPHDITVTPQEHISVYSINATAGREIVRDFGGYRNLPSWFLPVLVARRRLSSSW